MRNEFDPISTFKAKSDTLGGRIKSVNEEVPAPDDAKFREKLEQMSECLTGESKTPAPPPERNSIVIANLIREMTGSSPDDIQRTLWENGANDWRDDPDFFTAVGLIFAIQTRDDALHDRLTMGLLRQSSVAAAQPRR